MRPRVMPVLLLQGDGLVKGIQFTDYKYVGDPMNSVKIFDHKEVDELIFLDITATQENRTPRLEYIEKIAEECYMPFAVGGGIKNVEDIRKILYAGAEKISINTAAVVNPNLIQEAAGLFGSQSVVVSIDYKKERWSKSHFVYTHAGTKKTKLDPVQWSIQVAKLGAGEILLNSIDRDGTMQGYDIEMLAQVSNAVNIPVIACGGAGTIEDLGEAIHSGSASAVAAGSIFVFHGRRRAVLINYPGQDELDRIFGQLQL
ncbi:AglZ/HisF2 family acetamidino modification protein [Chloroflexota bacterium]